MLCIFIEYSIDCAHWLPNVPASHKCQQMHGHRYDIRFEISGLIDEKTGWIVDYAEVKGFVDPFISHLDHKTLNDLHGLTNPTCENICMWLHERISPRFAVSKIEVRETDRAGCVWRST